MSNRSDAAKPAAMARIAAINSRPLLNEPVRSLSQPIVNGPKKPPRVPTELMNARPPAAAVPGRNREGMV